MSISNAQFLELINSQSIEVRVKLHQLLMYLEEGADVTKGKQRKNYDYYEQERIKNMSEDILLELSSFNLMINLYNSKNIRTESEYHTKRYFSTTCIDITRKTNVSSPASPKPSTKITIKSKSKSKNNVA